jgi:methylmalonyl-CoA mutase N-terminal domain/subunit
MWAKLMKERFKAKNPKSCLLRFHTQTAGSSLTAQQPYNNVVRTTLQALAAVMGGTQSLHTNSFDEALGLPTEESARLALRTQQIIAHESGVASSVDPFGGSHLIESWTDRIESLAGELMGKIEDEGGMIASIETGFPQNEIEQAAYEYQKKIESEEHIIIGVNAYQSAETEVPVLKVDSQIERDQVARLKAFKASRDDAEVQTAVSALTQAAKDGGNLMPFVVEAIRKQATLGEVSDAMRTVFGEYR